ncbi:MULTISPECIES: YybH family protein [Inquilinus]|uniref:PhnB protein n=1 Tax=Inquilinus ginsengisoli TaxID=363840 RepID=A0ABU1JPH5_9PROT|nr:nuclear transport factor 2 family protein [Inquilinus ginsengisoli]MDR6290523.1 PhnB protein [Inquilinus ginsengisoli]
MTTTPDAATDEARIRALIDQRSQALRRKDARGVIAGQAEDFVLYSLAPPLRDQGEGTAGLEGWFATWRGPIGYELRDLAVTVGGDVAFCHGLARLTGTKLDGETADVWFRITFGLRRAAEGWTITHEHESVPFYMDGSLRAAVDLKP